MKLSIKLPDSDVEITYQDREDYLKIVSCKSVKLGTLHSIHNGIIPITQRIDGLSVRDRRLLNDLLTLIKHYKDAPYASNDSD